MGYAFWAEVIAGFHFLLLCFNVLGLVAILIGVLFHWSWVRNLWFRAIHLAVLIVVGMEAALDKPCPLTVWEYQLRALAGQEETTKTFVEKLLYSDFGLPPWAFNAGHIAFALLVLAAFLLAPPRWRRTPPSEPIRKPGRPLSKLRREYVESGEK